MSTTTAKYPVVPDFPCMNEGCQGTVQIVAYFEQSPARPVGQCTDCDTVHAQFETDAFETVGGNLGDFALRLASHRKVKVCMTPAGKSRKLSKFAKTYEKP